MLPKIAGTNFFGMLIRRQRQGNFLLLFSLPIVEISMELQGGRSHHGPRFSDKFAGLVGRTRLDQKSYVAIDNTKSIKRDSKNLFSSIKCRPLSIFFTISVALVEDVITLNKIFVPAVSDLVDIHSHLQMKFK